MACVAGACDTGSRCPAGYGGCSPDSATPPAAASTSCTTSDLAAIRQACPGPDGGAAGCSASFQKLLATNPPCYGCLSQFFGTGAYARCLAPYLTASCNHALTCASACQTATCDGCPAAGAKACDSAVFDQGGECTPWIYGYFCAQAAIGGPGAFCDFSKVNDAGIWLEIVGQHYCQ
jgi:hypothetical protein